MSEPVTVVIAVYNQLGYTQACLDAVFKHSPPDTQVVVWDNGSQDPVRALCASYPPDRLVCYCHPDNVGVPEAYNQCVNNLVKTEYVCFLHNDVIVTPDWLDRMMAHYDPQRKSHAVVCPRTNYCDNGSFVYDMSIKERSEKHKPPNKIHIAVDVIRSVLEGTFGKEGLDGFARNVSSVSAGSSQAVAELGDFCFLTRVDVVKAVGGFDERLAPHCYWDYQFHDCLEQSGYGVRLAGDVFVHHHGNLTSDGKGPPPFNFHELRKRNRRIYEQIRGGRISGRTSMLFRTEKDDKPRRPPALIAFTPYYVPTAPGGAEVSLHAVLRECAAFGVPTDVHCFLNDNGEPFREDSSLIVEGIRVVRHANCDEIRFSDAAVNTLLDAAPKAVLFQGERVKQAATACAELDLDADFSWFFRNIEEILRPNTYSIDMHKVMSKMRGPAFANSQFLAAEVKEAYRRQCIVVLPTVGTEWRVRTERKYLTCMAATEEKGVRMIIDLAARMPHHQFMVAGKTPPHIGAVLSEMPNISYMGLVHDTRPIYARTRALLVPSQVADSSPRVILEAQSSGIPVVGLDNGGIRETIGKGGICLPSATDAKDFANAIASMDVTDAYKRYCKLARENFERFRTHRGPYLFRRAIMGMSRETEEGIHSEPVDSLYQSLSRCNDPFRLVRAAVTEKCGSNRREAMAFITDTLLVLQGDAPQQVLDAAAQNFGELVDSVRSIKVRKRLGSLKILLTMKLRSGGGGVLTVLHLVKGLREAGHDAHFIEVSTHIHSVDGETLRKEERCTLHTLLLRDKIGSPLLRMLLHPDIVIFDDVDRIYEPHILDMTNLRFFLLCCGLPGVHPGYCLKKWLMDPKEASKFEKVFVRNLSYCRYLKTMYGDRIVSWQGGCDHEGMRKEFGRCQPPPDDGVLSLGTFSKWGPSEWWKGGPVNLLTAVGVSRALPKRDVRWYVPTAKDDHHIAAAKLAGLKLEYNIRFRRAAQEIVPQEEVLERMARTHVGIEMAFSDAFPRSVNEAMNLGLPTVLSSAIEHVRVNPDYEELCVVQNPNDMQAAVDKVVRLLTDRDAWMAAHHAALAVGKEYHMNREPDIFMREAAIESLVKKK